MNWKTLLIIMGIILLAAALYEMLTGGAIAAMIGCGMTFECYLPNQITSIGNGIFLITLGVAAILVTAAFGRRPGD